MPVEDYGLLIADQIVKMESDGPESRSPHIRFYLSASNQQWQCCLNIKSADRSQPESERKVAVYHNDHYQNVNGDLLKKLMDALEKGSLCFGWNDRKKLSSDFKLDYQRQNLFDWKQMSIEEPFKVPSMLSALGASFSELPPASGRSLTWEESSPNMVDIVDYFKEFVATVENDDKLLILVFGSRFQDSKQQGVHDIHMNQGSSGSYSKSDGVHQDGALIIRYSDPTDANKVCWLGYFTVFQSQYYPTDDQTGLKMPNSQPIDQLFEKSKLTTVEDTDELMMAIEPGVVGNCQII